MRIPARPWSAGLPLAGAAAVALLLGACSSDGVLAVHPEVDVGVARPPAPVSEPQGVALSDPVVASEPAMSSEPVVTSEPIVAGFPRWETPVEAAPVMPNAETECRRQLRRLGVTYRDLAPINDGGACRVDWPVKVSAINGVEIKPAATLTCAMAATFAKWTRNELQPAARWRYMSGVKTIHQGSSYSCRNIRGSGKASQHALGNAIDVMRIELKNGRDIDVRKPAWFAFRQRAFLNSVRAAGCSYFGTVLGPWYNADHADHFHFDIMQRRRVACR